MFETCPAPDRVIHVPLGAGIREGKSGTLLKTQELELIRLVIPAGKEIPPHRVPNEITVHVIEGLVKFSHDAHELELKPGEVVFLCPLETHSLKGLQDSTVLVTRLRPHAEIPETLSPA